MKSKFIQFTSEYEYIDGANRFVSASIRFNDWLAENPNVEVLSWQACPTGEDNQLTIVAKYREWEN